MPFRREQYIFLFCFIVLFISKYVPKNFVLIIFLLSSSPEQEQFLPVAQPPRCLPLLPGDTPTSRFNQSLSTSLAVSYSKSLSHNKLTQKQNTKVKYALGVSGFLFSMVTGPQNYRLQKLDYKRLYCASHFNKTAEPSFFQTFHFRNTTV